MSTLDKKTKILIATFSPWENGKRLPTNGSLDPLRDYLKPRIQKCVIIDQPLPGSDRVLPIIEIHTKKKVRFESNSWIVSLLRPFLYMANTPGTKIIFKIRDFLSVLDWGIRKKQTYDYFIGMESINALSGVLLRKFGLVKKVIYYVSDYSPNRYPIKWFNSLYIFLDRLAVKYSDYVWDVSKAMMPARIKAGLSPKYKIKCIHVPNGLYPDQIVKQLVHPKPYTIVFMGTLGYENGPDIIIDALPKIIKKFPKTLYHIIGGTKKDIHRLLFLARKRKVEDHIIFHGFIPKTKDMTKIISSCSIGVAPYRSITGSPRYYADAGKIRIYSAAGVPVVSSTVPPLGRELEKKGGAVIIPDTAESFSQAIIKLFNNKEKLKNMRKHAYQYAKENTWESTFTRAFSKMKE